eukprot:1161578-Pelagomonas_calceolata.AAC.5
MQGVLKLGTWSSMPDALAWHKTQQDPNLTQEEEQHFRWSRSSWARAMHINIRKKGIGLTNASLVNILSVKDREHQAKPRHTCNKNRSLACAGLSTNPLSDAYALSACTGPHECTYCMATVSSEVLVLDHMSAHTAWLHFHLLCPQISLPTFQLMCACTLCMVTASSIVQSPYAHSARAQLMCCP